jgi:CheY-like chemotaxis protein
VAVTGYGQERDRERTHDAGFDYHLVKPAALEDVERILATVAGRRGLQ